MSVPLREFQLYQLEILRVFDSICKEHKLSYWAAWGTLLGAARHKGFIPWDDDIDIWMPADDYLTFREVCKTALPDNYYLQSHNNNIDNFIPWQRIGRKDSTSLPYKYGKLSGEWGICIDILPLGSVRPQNRSKIAKAVSLFNKLSKKSQYRVDMEDQSGISRVYHFLMSCYPDTINLAAWRKQEKILHRSFERVPGNDVFCLAARRDREYVIGKVDTFLETVLVPFENTFIPVPKEYNTLLTSLYGPDWSKMPPEEKRVCHSGGGSDDVLVLFDEPYAKYVG